VYFSDTRCVRTLRTFCVYTPLVRVDEKLSICVMLARDAQAKLALIVAQCLSIHLSICVSVRDSLSHAYVRSIERREPPRLPAFHYMIYVDRQK